MIRLDDGTFFLNLPPEFRDVLRQVIEDLRERIAITDPSVHRLFPTAYPDNPDLDAEYQRLMRDELVMARFAVLDLVFDSLDEETLDEAQLLAWMQAMNVLRLSFGTELGVDHDEWQLPDDDPRVGIYELYSYLGVLVGSIIEALGSPT